MNYDQCKLLNFIKEEVISKFLINSFHCNEEWYEEWFHIVFEWHFENYIDNYSYNTFNEQLDIILKLSEDTWNYPHFVDEFEEWKEDLEENDDPDQFTAYPIYLCKMEKKEKQSQILHNYLSERITII